MSVMSDNLNSLYKEEERIREELIKHIEASNQLKEHMALVQDSMNAIFDTTITYHPQDDDELTVQTLGIRLFNDIATSLKMLLSGYYQVAFSIQRDILETGFLLDYFSIDRSKIQEWKHCSHEERRKQFAPAKVRKALDDRDGSKERKREKQYKLFCEHVSHPSFPGVKLVSQEGLAKIGPFVDEKLLKHTLFELAKQSITASNYYIKLFNPKVAGILTLHMDYIKKSKDWLDKYKRNL